MRVRRSDPPRLWAAVAAAVLLVLGMTGFLPGSSPAAHGAPGRLTLEGRAALAPGVDHLLYSMTSPTNVIHVARIKAGSKVTVQPILSNSRVIGDASTPGLERTSSMCRRANAVACVNGDFTACEGCSAPLGGVIRYGEVLRTPNPSWPQLWIGPRGMVHAGPVTVSGRVQASLRWQEPVQEGVTEERTKSLSVKLAGVNIPRPPDGVVLYTPAYAASTGSASGGVEVRVSPDGPAVLDRTIRVREVGGIRTTGNASIPTGAFVLSASGRSAEQLRTLRQEVARFPDRVESVTLQLQPSVPITHSLGGHPVILRWGEPLPPSPNDQASQMRHPRTLVGWNPAGDVWLVTIDGRQPGRSVGATYWEAASVLLQLGATDGLNLDGGGSTTFVAKRCASVCVRNRPSDGRERAVTTALAVIPHR